VSFLLRPRQIAKIDKWAKRKNTNRSDVVRQLIDRLTEAPPEPIILDPDLRPRKSRPRAQRSALATAAQCIEEFDEALGRLKSSISAVETKYNRSAAAARKGREAKKRT
jgi:hypothetical protein